MDLRSAVTKQAARIAMGTYPAATVYDNDKIMVMVTWNPKQVPGASKENWLTSDGKFAIRRESTFGVWDIFDGTKRVGGASTLTAARVKLNEYANERYTWSPESDWRAK